MKKQNVLSTIKIILIAIILTTFYHPGKKEPVVEAQTCVGLTTFWRHYSNHWGNGCHTLPPTATGDSLCKEQNPGSVCVFVLTEAWTGGGWQSMPCRSPINGTDPSMGMNHCQHTAGNNSVQIQCLTLGTP